MSLSVTLSVFVCVLVFVKLVGRVGEALNPVFQPAYDNSR